MGQLAFLMVHVLQCLDSSEDVCEENGELQNVELPDSLFREPGARS